MWWGIGIGTFLAIVVVLLASPVDFVFYLERRTAWRFRAEVRWLYGSVHFLFPRLKKPVRKPHREKKPRPPGKRRRLTTSEIIEIVRVPGLWQALRRSIADLFHAMRVHRLSAEWRVGFGDPFLTGMLWSFFGPLSGFASSFGWPLVLVPEFDSDSPTLTGMARGTLSLYPLKVIGAVLRLALSGPSIRVYRIFLGREKPR